MTYVILEPCIDVKDATCVEACPVDCIHSTDQDRQYFIDPDVCIECGACEPVCPVSAIREEGDIPDEWRKYIQINAAFFGAVSVQEFYGSGLLGPDGQPIGVGTAAFGIVIADVKAMTEYLVQRLRADPQLLYKLSPRQFEEIVAELLLKQGYEVELTAATRDGGKDLYVAQRTALGSFRYVVECKRYSPQNLVGVGLVRELYGVVQQERATAGILATTSFFTRDAKEFRQQLQYQMSLRDFWDITNWIKG